MICNSLGIFTQSIIHRSKLFALVKKNIAIEEYNENWVGIWYTFFISSLFIPKWYGRNFCRPECTTVHKIRLHEGASFEAEVQISYSPRREIEWLSILLQLTEYVHYCQVGYGVSTEGYKISLIFKSISYFKNRLQFSFLASFANFNFECRLADSRSFKNFSYQGGVKSTVSWVFEDLKLKISEG